MKPSLQLKLSQHLALTPQLQQSIRLLQLSTLELEQELEKYLQENPLLERMEEEYAPPLPGTNDTDSDTAEASVNETDTATSSADDESWLGDEEIATTKALPLPDRLTMMTATIRTFRSRPPRCAST